VNPKLELVLDVGFAADNVKSGAATDVLESVIWRPKATAATVVKTPIIGKTTRLRVVADFIRNSWLAHTTLDWLRTPTS
jgi:hypothetical protein